MLLIYLLNIFFTLYHSIQNGTSLQTFRKLQRRYNLNAGHTDICEKKQQQNGQSRPKSFFEYPHTEQGLFLYRSFSLF